MGVLTLSIVARLIWQRVDLNTIEMSKETNEILTENYLVSFGYALKRLKTFNLFFLTPNFKANNEKEVTQLFSKIWSLIFLPLLFSLIGNEIDFQKLTLQLIGLLIYFKRNLKKL